MGGEHAGSAPTAPLAGLKWFLVFTKPSGEALAKTNLERQGYRVYYPRLLRPALRKGHWADKIVSLFPRYLFVQVDGAHQSLAPVRSTLGVSGIIRFGVEAAIIPDGIVSALIHRADPESGLHRLNRDVRFRAGAPVRIVDGAFQGLDGIFERDVGDDRAIVLLQLLGHETQVRVPQAYVAPRHG